MITESEQDDSYVTFLTYLFRMNKVIIFHMRYSSAVTTWSVKYDPFWMCNDDSLERIGLFSRNKLVYFRFPSVVTLDQ